MGKLSVSYLDGPAELSSDRGSRKPRRTAVPAVTSDDTGREQDGRRAETGAAAKDGAVVRLVDSCASVPKLSWDAERGECRDMLLRAMERREKGGLQQALRAVQELGMHNTYEAQEARIILARLITEEVGINAAVVQFLLSLDEYVVPGSDAEINRRDLKNALRWRLDPEPC